MVLDHPILPWIPAFAGMKNEALFAVCETYYVICESLILIPELSNFGSPPAEPGVYPDSIKGGCHYGGRNRKMV